jgi:hypothetical protein
MQNGKLVVTKQFIYPVVDPFLPPTDLVDLFGKIATIYPTAFWDSYIVDDLLNHCPIRTDQINAPFLMARADGTYEVEIFKDGKITERATAEVKEYKVAALQWK